MKNFRWIRSFLVVFGLWACVFAPQSRAQSISALSQKSVPVYEAPSTQAKIIGKIPKGRRMTLEKSGELGFYKLKSSSGRVGYVSAEGLKISVPQSETWGGETAGSGKGSSGRMTFDLGVSAGSIGDESYTEFNLGLNWFFTEWLAWRNAAFYRIIEGDDYYGLDTSARFFHFVRWGSASGATLFGGPGFRFASLGDNLPFAEAGLIVKLGGFSIGGGAKAFVPGLVNSDMDSDTQYFIILSGSGSIF